MFRLRTLRGAVALLALVGLACGGLGPPPDVESWTPVPTAGEEDATASGEENGAPATPAGDDGPSAVKISEGSAGTVTLSDAPAGRACFGTRIGVTCLEPDGAWQTYTREDSPLGGNAIYATDSCPNGDIVLAHGSGISFLGDDGWRELEDGWDGGSVEAVACADDALWVAHYRGASRFDGGWQTYPSTDLSTDPDARDLVNGVDLLPNGEPWVTTAAGAARFDGTSWTIYEEGSGFSERLFVQGVAVDANGAAWIPHSGGVAILADGARRMIDPPAVSTSFETVTVDAQFQAWFGTLSDGLLAYGGNSWATFNVDNSGLPANQINDVAVDARGRVWAATAYGLAVYDGTAWTTYQMHTAPLVDNTIETVAVVRGGPDLPAPQRAADGGLSGRLLEQDGTTPLAGAVVDICPKNVAFFLDEESPCQGQPLVLRTESGADGHFALENVPPGWYSVAVEIGPGQWATLTGEFGFNRRVQIPAGDVRNLGDLIFEEEES